MDEEQEVLFQQLEQADTSLGFLFLIVFSVMLSYWATIRQRDALCLAIHGRTEQAERVGEVSRIRLGASALIVGALGFFFMQALELCRDADPDDPTAQKRAWLDVIAGFLVLLAALIRLFEQNMVRRAQCFDQRAADE